MNRSENDAFSRCHPAVGFAFFLGAIGLGAMILHPAYIVVSGLCAVTYYCLLRGAKGLKMVALSVPVFLFLTFANPLVNHDGQRVLGHVFGRPYTFEALVYGMVIAGMLIAMLLWAGCYNAVMTSDKFIWLFGRIIPALSLLLSMALRFVPEFTRRLRAVHDARRTLAAGDDRRAFRRVREALAAFSILVTWSLESAIETADSMRARGYGLRGRSAFSIYRFARWDAFALAWIAFCGVLIVVGWAAGLFDWRYFPSTSFYRFASPLSALFPLTYLALCLTPVCIDLLEDRKWNSLRSKI